MALNRQANYSNQIKNLFFCRIIKKKWVMFTNNGKQKGQGSMAQLFW